MPVNFHPYHRVVLLQNDKGVDAPLDKLTALLAQAVTVGHKDPILVMAIGPTAPPGIGEPMIPKKIHGVDHVWVVAGNDQGAAPIVRDAINGFSTSYAAIYLHSMVGGPDHQYLEPLIKRLVLVITNRKQTFKPSDMYSTLIAEILSAPPPAPPSKMSGISAKVSAAGQQMADIIADSMKAEDQVDLPKGPVEPQWVRLRLDLEAIKNIADPTFDSMSDALKATLLRWARAVTNRRVGLALGGSGAWSYAHVEFVRGLVLRGVPIDMISGASGGTFVGAYYAAQGTQGLDMYVDRALTLQLLIVPAFFTMSVIEWMFDYDLGLINLDDLEIPLFPVATDLTKGKEEIIVNNSVAFAARASASAPGIFASTIVGKTIYVDGAVTDNVPATVVADLGCALVIASNALPAPISRQIHCEPKTFVGRFLQEFRPLARLFDTFTSGSLLFHDGGDFQARAADAAVIYDPTPVHFPITKAFLFITAHKIMKSTVADPAFTAALDAAEQAWINLSAPMGPPALPIGV